MKGIFKTLLLIVKDEIEYRKVMHKVNKLYKKREYLKAAQVLDEHKEYIEKQFD